MTKIEAIFENGVFRPVHPVQIDEGVHVELMVDDAVMTAVAQPILPVLAEIAALPLEGPDDGFSGADHDRVLYNDPPPR